MSKSVCIVKPGYSDCGAQDGNAESEGGEQCSASRLARRNAVEGFRIERREFEVAGAGKERDFMILVTSPAGSHAA
eukprot:83939-Hanusia_phi.AAC.3